MLRAITQAWIETGRVPISRQRLAELFVLAVSILVLGLASRVDREWSLFWFFGLAFGFVLQRSRFCFASAFRDLFLLRHGRVMKGILAGMLVATLGFTVLMTELLPNPLPGLLAPQAHISPLALSLPVGGVLFGLGMVLAGGCVSGSMYRMGEGYIASWVSFLGILGGLLVSAYTWNWWWQFSTERSPTIWLPTHLGYGGAAVLTLALLAGAYLLVLWWESRGGIVIPESQPPSPFDLSFGEQVRAWLKRWLVHPWPVVTGGVVLGMLNVFLYVAHHPWRIVGELSAWASAVAGLVNLAPGPLLGVDQLAGCTLTGGEGGLLNHMTFLVVGMVVGSLIAALLAHEFKVRVPRKRVRYAQSLGGGLLMGYGSGVAIGCTVGAFFSAIPSLGMNGWVFALALTAGSWLGVQVIRRLP